ncbi:MAG TPA: nucleotide exchange factor GrpE [Phycisphaerales bacterium]|nr:nucleotide exchange factor GrpE [Phycisphaerales bacterium]HMP37396.1 nucleotide exchange factor GrpE [Phycisphaerales bacterium]
MFPSRREFRDPDERQGRPERDHHGEPPRSRHDATADGGSDGEADDFAEVDSRPGRADGADARPFRDDQDDLEGEILRLRCERDEAVAARQRALADFANYQRRADESERRAFQSGSVRIARALIAPLDHLDLALGQDLAAMKLDQLLAGVRMVREEFYRALDASGVSRFSPARGDDFDPQRHEAMLRQPAADLPENTVLQCVQPGYAMGDVILRPAKVIVSGG